MCTHIAIDFPTEGCCNSILLVFLGIFESLWTSSALVFFQISGVCEQEGRQEGKEEGREEGRKQGRKEERTDD